MLAWLLEEATAPLADIAIVVSEIDNKDAHLLIPATVYSEILMGALTKEQKNNLDAFVRRSNVESVDLTVNIASKAAEIRERGHRERPERKVKAADSHMAATAIMHNATVLHSLDKDLLHLDGHATVENLAITKPRPISGQKGLLD